MSKEKNTVLSLKNDYCFKAVYGSDNEDSKEILKALLNEILDRGDDPIEHLEYKNPFQTKMYIEDKETVLDIKATTNSKEIIDIEMQIVWDKDMEKRLLYYAGGLIRESLNGGNDYGNMLSTITICITNSVVYKDTERYISNFYYIEEDSHIKFSDKSRICCIELPKVNREGKPVDELSTLEICLEYLRCADETDSEYLAELIRAGGKELQMAQEKFVKVTQDEIMREQAIAREKFQRDKVSMQCRVEEAEQKAEEAQKNAEEAQKNAEEAQKNAEKAQKNAEKAQKNLEEAEKRIKQAADKLKERGMTEEEIEGLFREEQVAASSVK